MQYVHADDISVMTEEEYLSLNGGDKNKLGEPALHKNSGPHSKKTWHSMVEAQSQKDWTLLEKRQQLRAEYREKVNAGVLRSPTRKERLIAIASRHEDLESTQAARRLLLKHFDIVIE